MLNAIQITDPTSIAIVLLIIIGIIFSLEDLKPLKKIFRYVPPITWAYFIPMTLTTFGVLPDKSPAYTWITHNILPASLILLIMTTDIPSILKLGGKAISIVLAGTLGIVIGGPITLLIFQNWLPPEAWKGFGALAGSWIGGSVNMMAVAEGIGTPANLLAPLIVVDTVVGYSWFGLLIYLSTFQNAIDKRLKADRTFIDKINTKLDNIRKTQGVPITIKHLAFMLAIGFGLGRLCLEIGNILPDIGQVISSFTWTIVLVATVGMVISFTPLRKLEGAGASRVGYIGIFLILASIGSRADLTAVLDTPVFFAAGIVWILIHGTVLAIATWLFKAPVFFFATGSMANIGGPSTAPITASVYQSALAPVGLLMAVFGMLIGTYAALICAQLCSLI